MNKKITVAILFGGRSAEHEVSLMSARNIITAINKEKYDIVLIGIDKKGKWVLEKPEKFLLNSENPRDIQLAESQEKVAFVSYETTTNLVNLTDKRNLGAIDVVFPVLHGPYGEDGTIQGLLTLANIPFVGAGVLGSAIGMDKDVMKRLLRDAGIPIGKFLVFTNREELAFDQIKNKLGLPFFVKPANLGSSVGVTKVHNVEEFGPAITLAFSFDKKILIEEYIKGREIECAVLGNDDPKASLPGEIIPHHEFYDYEAKYIDENGAMLKAPTILPDNNVNEIQALAIKTFTTLCCFDMARVDFFMQDDGRLFVNEINTIPGFTSISMYPKLWEVSGVSQTELIDRLLTYALKRGIKGL